LKFKDESSKDDSSCGLNRGASEGDGSASSAWSLAAACMLMLYGSLANALDAKQAAALASFQALLDGLGKRDKAAMIAEVLPGASGTFVRDGRPKQMTIEALADHCGTDIATLVLSEGRWLITSIEDNHREACGRKKF
jgi:hypothetical protein